jgi:glycosyltransferase involved in cell wall biosynthesis
MDVSVVMTAYNAEKFIKQAIESILGQVAIEFELIIIIDGSTDGTLDLVKKYIDERIKLIVNPVNRGQSYSRNLGISNALGKYIAIMDADDVAIPERLSKQFHFLEENYNISICGSNVIIINELGNKIRNRNLPESDLEIKLRLLFDCCVVHPTVMFRKSDFFEQKLKYDTDFVYSQDFELWSRAMDKLKFYNIQEPLLLFRAGHSSSISDSKRKEQRQYALRVIDRNLEKTLGPGAKYPNNFFSLLVLYHKIINSDYPVGTRDEKIFFFRKRILVGLPLPHRLKDRLRRLLIY